MPHIKLYHISSQPTLVNPALMGESNTYHLMDTNICDLEMGTGKWLIIGATQPIQLIVRGAHMIQVSLGTILVDQLGLVLVMAFKLLAHQVSENIHHCFKK